MPYLKLNATKRQGGHLFLSDKLKEFLTIFQELSHHIMQKLRLDSRHNGTYGNLKLSYLKKQHQLKLLIGKIICFFVTFNIIISHIFPENFIETSCSEVFSSCSEEMKIFFLNINYLHKFFRLFDFSMLQRN